MDNLDSATSTPSNTKIVLGQKLAALRIEKNLTQKNIADQIHVKENIIIDIENEQFLNTPAVFLKNHIKAYAKIVGLPESEYIECFEKMTFNHPTYQMKNYSHKQQRKKFSKRLFWISVLIILMVVAGVSYFVIKEEKSNLVEVSRYVTPVDNSTNINSREG